MCTYRVLVTHVPCQRNFYLPMEEAGKRWGVSTTIIKRVCRKFGIERWPYRQIQSAQKKIAALEEMLRTRTRTPAEQEKVKVCPDYSHVVLLHACVSGCAVCNILLLRNLWAIFRLFGD